MKNEEIEEVLKEFDEKFKRGLPSMKIYSDGRIEHPEIRSFLENTLSAQREAIRKRVKEGLQPCLDYCKEVNGREDCKNCGLSDELIDSLFDTSL